MIQNNTGGAEVITEKNGTEVDRPTEKDCWALGLVKPWGAGSRQESRGTSSRVGALRTKGADQRAHSFPQPWLRRAREAQVQPGSGVQNGGVLCTPVTLEAS